MAGAAGLSGSISSSAVCAFRYASSFPELRGKRGGGRVAAFGCLGVRCRDLRGEQGCTARGENRSLRKRPVIWSSRGSGAWMLRPGRRDTYSLRHQAIRGGVMLGAQQQPV
jgi:hypothetical protein